MDKEILRRLQEAERVLIGIGEEFEIGRSAEDDEGGSDFSGRLRQTGMKWALPLWRETRAEKEENRRLLAAVEMLSEALKEKDYFVVTTLTGSLPGKSVLRQDRIVSPCGGVEQKQCANGCEGSLLNAAEAELEGLACRLEMGEIPENPLGTCPRCGADMVLNNIFADHYDENGYLKQWQVYMEWLKGTLNRRLCVLELGVGMNYPSVIRWPFEKTAYLNRRASFIRVNERLFQLPEELREKGISVQANSIQWLLSENVTV